MLQVELEHDAVTIGAVPRGVLASVVERQPAALDPGALGPLDVQRAVRGHAQTEVEPSGTDGTAAVRRDHGPGGESEVEGRHHPMVSGEQLRSSGASAAASGLSIPK